MIKSDGKLILEKDNEHESIIASLAISCSECRVNKDIISKSCARFIGEQAVKMQRENDTHVFLYNNDDIIVLNVIELAFHCIK